MSGIENPGPPSPEEFNARFLGEIISSDRWWEIPESRIAAEFRKAAGEWDRPEGVIAALRNLRKLRGLPEISAKSRFCEAIIGAIGAAESEEFKREAVKALGLASVSSFGPDRTFELLIHIEDLKSYGLGADVDLHLARAEDAYVEMTDGDPESPRP